MKGISTLFTILLLNASLVFGQCYFSVTPTATSAMYTGDTITSGTHHVCFNSYLSYDGSGFDTLFLEDQVTVTILSSTYLVVYADSGCAINYGGTGNNQLLNIFYDSTVTYFDLGNLSTLANNQCPGGTIYSYDMMASPPNQGCTYQPVASVESLALEMSVFPNPFDNHLTIRLNKDALGRVYDVSGKVVRQYQLTEGSNTLNTASLKSGIYFFQIDDGRVMKLVRK